MKSQVLFSPFKIGEFCKESMYSIIDVYNLRNLISCSMQLQRFRLDNFTKKETPPPTPTFTSFTSFLQAKPVDSTPMLFFVRTIVRLQPHIHLSSVLLTHEPRNLVLVLTDLYFHKNDRLSSISELIRLARLNLDIILSCILEFQSGFAG